MTKSVRSQTAMLCLLDRQESHLSTVDVMTQLMMTDPRSGYARPRAAVSQRLPYGIKMLLAGTPDPESLQPHLQKVSASGHGPTRPKRAPRAPNNSCKCTRSSRRLARKPPEFGRVQERRGAPPLYQCYLQQPSAGSGRSQQPLKGLKPQGISRTRRQGQRKETGEALERLSGVSP